ncbi:hypothetical protein [Corynebacterium pacaense]|uniref:hypothetical protein n=1 Tax=Corynebacterium pacaense TaxID=1816684 RepID=UPI0009B9A25E|nr:hypothetical protein [Corynebacterium pacaense]
MKSITRGKLAASIATAGIIIQLAAPAVAAPVLSSDLVQGSSSSSGGGLEGIPKSSLSIPLYNNSPYVMVLRSVSGDNAGVPQPGTILDPGQGYQDFEVVFRAAKTTTVTAVYDLVDTTGINRGSATIKLSVNAMGARSVSSSYSAGVGLQSNYVGNGAWEVESSTHTEQTIDATDAQAATLVQRFCTSTNNSASCAFKVNTKAPSTQEKLLASGYMLPGDGESGSVSLSSGYESEVSVTTGTSVSAGLKLGDILSASISEDHESELSFSEVFHAEQEVTVAPGDTGYIWGAVPMITYTGAMTINVGNTTWTINNFAVNSPDIHTPLSRFTTTTYHGDYPIGRPDSPPAS